MPTHNELKRLAKLRLKEAEALFDADLFDGAFYTGGYAVELALKARVCKMMGLPEYLPRGSSLERAFKTHSLNDLLILACLKDKMERESREETDLAANWLVVIKWNPTSRYSLSDSVEDDARSLLDAIGNRETGILPWIAKRW